VETMTTKNRLDAMEAASSSSDSSSDEDSSDDSGEENSLKTREKKSHKEQSDSDADDNKGDAKDEDEDEDDENDMGSEAVSSDDDSDGDDEQDIHDADNDVGSEAVSSDSEVEEDEDEAGLPLHQRLQQKEEQGDLSLHKVRARKSRALEVASERLKKMKQTKNDSQSDQQDDDQVHKKKKSKHAPTEVSSSRKEFFNRGARHLNESGIGVEIGAHRYKPLDPRASSLSGHFNEEHFEKNYEFIEELRDKEIATLKKRIAARKTTGKKGQQKRRKLNIAGGDLDEDQEELKMRLQEKADLERRKVVRAAKTSVKRKLREEVAQGTRGAYFLKRKEKKRMELDAKFEEIRKRGGDKAVEKTLEKKRKKNKSRDAGLFAK
jgi:ribosomal RNA-processing protein 36